MTAVRSRAGRRLLGRRTVGAALAVTAFLVSWSMLGHGLYTHGRITDAGFYQDYGLKVRNGEVPYRDFAVAYPPGSLPAFVAPTYVGHPTDLGSYGRWFARLMELCGLACLALVLLARAPGTGVAFLAVSPLLVGHLMLDRFDLWPAVFVTGAVVAFADDRHRIGWLALAFAFAAKLFAVVALPIALVWTYRRRGRRELERGIAVWVAAVAAIFAPFVAIAPHGVWESVWGQLSRPIQIESLVGSALIRFGNPTIVTSHESLAIRGHGGLAVATTAVEICCLVALWIAFARGPAGEERFVRYVAACVCAFVAFGKVLSPQFLIWLVPLLALVRGSRGYAAIALLAVAAIDTQYWFRSDRYAAYISHSRFATAVLARDLLLIAILAILAVPGARFRRPRHLPGDA